MARVYKSDLRLIVPVYVKAQSRREAIARMRALGDAYTTAEIEIMPERIFEVTEGVAIGKQATSLGRSARAPITRVDLED